MTVFAYTRVSTDRQANEGESLDVQERTVAGYAMMRGMTVDRVFSECGVSGSKPLADRPEGGRMLETLKAGDIVITPKLDRMFRSANDALANLETLNKAPRYFSRFFYALPLTSARSLASPPAY